VLLEIAREQGFKGLVAGSGGAALSLMREFPPSVLTLDIFLPDMQGWRILDRIKTDLNTRHIPICVVSTDDSCERAFNSGAIGFLTKPLQSRDAAERAIAELRVFIADPTRTVLILAAHAGALAGYAEHLRNRGVRALVAADAAVARTALVHERIDCMVLDYPLSALRPEQIFGEAGLPANMLRRVPVLLYSEREEVVPDAWKHPAEGYALRQVRSTERLLDQTWYFLHSSLPSLPQGDRSMLEAMYCSNSLLAGRKVLVVDDDMRNIFALTTVMDEQGMAVVSADNGHDAIKLLLSDAGIEIVLMDIMMPEMDGMETIRRIRRLPRGQDLPIVAVTAKAMKGDREKCIEAGAWDYLSKPVDTTHLLAVLRAWLHR
jgi:CheY-like chemotaxis protein